MFKANRTSHFLSQLRKSNITTGSLDKFITNGSAGNNINALSVGINLSYLNRPSRSLSSSPVSSPINFKKGIILGIETSCDDTGIAIVNQEREVLGESLNSQLQTHLK